MSHKQRAFGQLLICLVVTKGRLRNVNGAALQLKFAERAEILDGF